MAVQEEFEKQGNLLFRYRSYFPLIILSAGIIIFLNKKLNPGDNSMFMINDLQYITCLISCFIGMSIRIYTVGYSPDRTSGRNTERQGAQTLNKRGLYSIVRHPLYLGNFFIWFGLCLLIGSVTFLIVFILVYWIYYERIIYSEEKFLRRRFGDDYLKWTDSIPAFVPKLRNFVKPDMKFNLRKVLRKEQDGFYAIILIVSLFGIADHVLATEKIFFQGLHWYIILLAGTMIYVFLKFIKKKTRIIDI